MLSLAESHALQQLLDGEFAALESALVKFCTEQARKYEADCAQQMRRLPRQFEAASDASARADAYATFFNELTWFATNHHKERSHA